ncbi:Rne/Rng family ribonuclease [Mycobacterium sp. 1274756.6]|uniref:Rne/Rng family ribonuclease n=1 Tax=Mycobacterium sp. 1274756.6 TaxID=1834076 RepID=UPI000ABB653D|nr:Rne/Rng family ribonuclease [Mycobacterium sp. 1274756.6]
MSDDVQSISSSEAATEAADLPEKLRVHSLARVLGTTSRRVLDALADLDGRIRSAHSSVDRVDAVRVRDLLAAPDLAEDPTPEVPAVVTADEPESRLMLETTATQAEYMPLFVAPEPVPAVVAGTGSADDGDTDDSDEGEDGEDGDRPAGRRRRRGRRGRGRGRGEQGADDTGTDSGAPGDQSGESGKTDGATDNDAGDKDDNNDSDASGDKDDNGDNGTGEGTSRRRRRRRRRKSGSGDDTDDNSSDDPPNTVVHERSPRSKDSEIQGINGSTRLEAKRQRRRDGRDAGRRRPPVLSEAEFLARRESVERTMVVRDKVRTEAPHEGTRYTQIAVLEDGIVVEHFVTSGASTSLVGNIYLGIVQNVLPSMEAAFVDIGRGRNGVLYAGEVNWEAAGLGGANRKIEQALKPGDYVVVQVSKDPVGHKGARLTTQVSLAGRYLVYVPGASSTGISRKLPDTERQRLKQILREVVPADAGVIIRTASEGIKEDDIRADVNRLQERWSQIDATAKETEKKAAGAAVALYEEPDVLVKVIRDLFNEDFSRLIVSGDDAWATITGYMDSVAPELLSKVDKYEPPSGPDGQPGPDVFAVHRIDEQLTKALDRKVWLPSGGTLVIDRTEAMTVVDVNTGKFTGAGGNLEETVTKNNLEAAEEIVRQLRLRDIGGIVVIDFIDMVLESNRDLVLRRLTEALARDRTRHQVSEVTSLGLVQLTRKRLGTGLIEAFSSTCPHCTGRGITLHADPVESGSSSGRRSDNGGRRGRRSRRGRSEEPAVAKVPTHTAGEHPMFKAMAAAQAAEDTEDAEAARDADTDSVAAPVEGAGRAGHVGEADTDPAEVDENGVDEDEQDYDDTDDTDDTDDFDTDYDSDYDDLDDDDEEEDDDEDDFDADDHDTDEHDADEHDEDRDGPAGTDDRHWARPRRRRAAARPAGPPAADN